MTSVAPSPAAAAADALPPSPIVCTVDLERDGVQHGFLRLPYSHDGSAWGAIMIPIAVAKNGEGPTALLTGGNHGDEYEGPVALFDLARRLTAEEVTGRVIVVPAMNYPAFRAATRTSPLDRGNMNRSFPGRPDGTPTQKIADFFQRHLVPLADLALDLHSGGKTLDFLPLAAAHCLPDAEQERRCMAGVAAFGAPWSLKMVEIDNVGMYDTAVEAMGKTFVTTELGGGGGARAATVGIARRGIANLLRHAGILAGRPEPAQTRWLEMPSDDCFCFADEEGLLEPCLDLGADVRRGEVVARIHPVGRTGGTPKEYRAGLDGILASRHFPGLVGSGDCLAVVATPCEAPA